MTNGNRVHHLSTFRAGAILVFIALLPSAALAQSTDPTRAKAQATLREGNAALEQGRAAEALAKFTEAYGLFPSPKIHYNLGQAHSLLHGHEALAYDEMCRFLDAALHADVDLRAAAEKQRKQLRSKVGVITVIADPVDADLLVDDMNKGKVSPEWPTVLGIGTYRIALKKDNTGSAAQTIVVAGGEAQEVRLRVLPPTLPVASLSAAPTSIPLPAANSRQAFPVPATQGAWTRRRKAGVGEVKLR